MARHEHLPIYKQSYELLNQAVHITKDFPREFKFTVGQRLRDEILQLLVLHPFKKRIAPIYEGIDFIGFIHKPFRRQIRARTAGKMVSLVHQWKKSSNALDSVALTNLRNSLNSYFGISRWSSSYRLRKHIGDELSSLFIRPDEKYLKLILPKIIFRNRHKILHRNRVFRLQSSESGPQILNRSLM